ncbi:FIST signal transduction protein [Aeromonas enteropelogenes]|uniref:FIST signal transduction protein n=1 Tax=Aeromonas enteropelogenes TaxID=29489 RepID=UPI00228659A5|nr:FIST N-terminal domain-containing protein [Aeromonas enteropelogenes]MCZ0752609.1 FIST C-terminal domain-containing protein [Aeromonas enteropelogenes]
MVLNFLTVHSLEENSLLAAQDICARLHHHAMQAPSLLLVYFTQAHDAAVLREQLGRQFPTTPLLGCSSCGGVMTEMGHHVRQEHGVAVAAFYDEKGAYGVAGAEGEPVDVRLLLRRAMLECGRPGELPQLVLVHASPGQEEEVLASIEAEFGHSVPVVGGSAADNKVSGDWQLCWSEGQSKQGVALAVLYPGCQLAFQFHSGYVPAESNGAITSCDGREVLTIEHEPAAEVYARWCGRQQSWPVGPILHESTLTPLARQVGTLDGVPYYKLSHPEAVTERGGLRLFTDVTVGERLWLMYSSQEGLLQRSLSAIRIDPEYGVDARLQPVGALIIFCAGCRLALGDMLYQFVEQSQARLGQIPFITPFTFGEQGRLPHGELAHGNLMVSSVIFLTNDTGQATR